MAILHTPRTLAAIARGLIKRRRRHAATNGSASRFVGFAPLEGISAHTDSKNDNAHVYGSRPSVLWDVDYLGHMNNASYLTHAEYARWEWTAETGALQTMHDQGMHFVVTQTAVRFRKEIGLFDRFKIRSHLEAIDDRHLWMHQTFRSDLGEGRILAQVLVQAVAVKHRTVVPPRTVLEAVGLPENVVKSLVWEKDGTGDDSSEDAAAHEKSGDGAATFLERFRDLDAAFRREASADDERLRSASTTRE